MQNESKQKTNRWKTALKVLIYGFGLSLLYWVILFSVLTNNKAFQAFRYMGF